MAKIQSTVFIALLVFASCHQSHAFSNPLNNPFNKNMTEAVHNIKNEIVELVNKTTTEVRDSVNRLTDIVRGTLSSTREVANNSEKHITDDMNRVMDRVNSILSNNIVLTEECKHTVEAFKQAYNHLINKTDDCINSGITNGTASLRKIRKHAEEIKEQLNGFKNEAVKSAERISGPASFFSALNSINEAGFNAVRFVGEQLPELTLEIGYLATNILNLPSEIGYCFSTQFVGIDGSNYKQTMEKVKQCSNFKTVS